MTSCIVAGYTVSNITPLNLTIEEAIEKSKRTTSFLTHMLGMMEPQQIKSNETAKDAYEECRQLKEYLSEQLWSVIDHEGVSSIQSALDDLMKAIVKYEMINDIVEGEWEFIDASSLIVNNTPSLLT
ncbi:hypothetical protein G6F37_012134 [Rhizopus arrhizus]|nr:hypothetical protein G6F38_012005 [Rhizopus arrhizus]KAG1145505.1 hypothetical protein G6F37_012134 [Rhizopus arrhizus]